MHFFPSQATECLIGLGSNLGEREEFLQRTADLLSSHDAIANFRLSRPYATRPVGGPPGQGEFLNAAARFETTLSPPELLTLLQDTERDIGRQRMERWGPRVIDLDLLLYGAQVIESDVAPPDSHAKLLQVPHPRMAYRRFVLAPAAEIAGEMRHPLIGWTIGQLLDHLNNHPPYVTLSSDNRPRATDLARQLADATGGRAISRPASKVFSVGGELSPKGFEHSAREYFTACDHLLPGRGSWSPDDLVVSDFHPADILRHAPANLNADVKDDLLRRAGTAKLCFLDRGDESEVTGETPVPLTPVPLVAGPWLDVTGMEELQAVREMTAAVQAM